MKLHSEALNSEILKYLSGSRIEQDIELRNFRVLDFGCKDGRAVAELLELGYDAYGIDIAESAISKGRDSLESMNLNPERLIFWEEPSKPCPIVNNSFDFVFSYHVLEHVDNESQVAAEIARITSPSGAGIHIFPAPYRPIEAHLSMPFVHWLPKGGLRKLGIRMCTRFGFEPAAWKLTGSIDERADRYFRYSCEKTHYRTFGAWRRLFEQHGLEARDVSARHPRLSKFKAMLGERSVSAAARTFRTIECSVSKKR